MSRKFKLNVGLPYHVSMPLWAVDQPDRAISLTGISDTISDTISMILRTISMIFRNNDFTHDIRISWYCTRYRVWYLRHTIRYIPISGKPDKPDIGYYPKIGPDIGTNIRIYGYRDICPDIGTCKESRWGGRNIHCKICHLWRDSVELGMPWHGSYGKTRKSISHNITS